MSISPLYFALAEQRLTFDDLTIWKSTKNYYGYPTLCQATPFGNSQLSFPG
jgi:hypothetical protein